MCGFCGIWYFDPTRPVDRGLLGRMAQTIAHRGPDEEDFQIEGPVGLGFRRLSIIDLAGSHQPMSNEDGSAWIVFNGEIYNFQQLRAELATRHTFRTAGDTETILHEYEEAGADCVRRLRGMFAFAVWDRRQQRMTLAVDRFGKKPLYYLLDDEKLIFASELKALLLHPGFERTLDEEALADYLSAGYVLAPRTIFKGIRKLPPGHTLTITAGGAARLQAYWRPDLAAPDGYDRRPAADLAAELRGLLTEAVRLRMISDVPLGAFLSGGVDSSAVVCLMSQVSTQPVRTFSIGFEEARFDESAFAGMVARHCGTRHTHEVVRPDIVSLLPKLARQFDEPFADNSMIPTYYVSQMARQHVTVALSGDGGDEVFAGYPWYRRGHRLVTLQRFVPGFFRSGLAHLAALLPRLSRAQDYFARLDQPAACWPSGEQCFDTGQLRRLVPAGRSVPVHLPWEERQRALAATEQLDWLSQLQHLDFTGYLPGDILVKVDRASMLPSLEVRSPLLDHLVFEFMARVPPWLKMNARESKVLLKQAVRDLLPAPILTRRKRGFDLPMAEWLRGPLQPLLRDMLMTPAARCRDLFAPAYVARLVEEHAADRANHRGRLWTLLCFELWAKEYLPVGAHA